MAEEYVTSLVDKPSIDITAPKAVQIDIREDGKVLWINVDGICRLRCCQIELLEVEDRRTKK